MGPVKTWSFSTLKSFEDCKFRVWLSKVEGAPRAPNGQAAARGIRVHDAAEKYVKGELAELPEELENFRGSFETLRLRYGEGVVSLEEDWGFTRDWEPVDWKHPDLWAKMKLDAIEFDGEDSAYVIDYKTGKKMGNEIKHTDQGICYAIGTMMKYPNIESIQVEFWYLDKNEKLMKLYNRNQLMMLVPNLERRAHTLTSCKTFDPNPNEHTCRWCDHREMDSCAYAVSR